MGHEAAAIYKRLLAAIKGANPGHEKQSVDGFKQDCKLYGQGDVPTLEFYRHLEAYFGNEIMVDLLLPDLCRLIPTEKKRRKLLLTQKKEALKKRNQKHTLVVPAEDTLVPPPRASEFDENILTARNLGKNPALMRKDSSSSEFQRLSISSGSSTYSTDSAPEGRLVTSSRSSRASRASRFSRLGASRYSDDPNCAICTQKFEITKRRHQCRRCGKKICSNCSPLRMLIPPDQVCSEAKKYDPAIQQRVCTMCAPDLQHLQDELNVTFANCHKENPHEAKARFHFPYSKSLEKECRNAADIIGNFFRPQFGAESDRRIPVSFLKKAYGLAFLTVVKAGLLITAKAGTGIVIAKLPDGSWSAPSAIGTAGFGGGLEAGGEIVEIMIVLGSHQAVRVFYKTQINIGGGLSVAVGPYGRAADAAASASTKGINSNYSYSHSRGLYAGVSLSGAVITSRKEMNSNFYGKSLSPEELLDGTVPRPRAAQCLYDALDKAMEGVSDFEKHESQVISSKKKCPECNCKKFVLRSFSKKCKACGHTHIGSLV